MTTMQTQRWLGIEWIGTPWPKRLRLKARFPFLYVAKRKGCGCMRRPKAWLIRFAAWLNLVFPYTKGQK